MLVMLATLLRLDAGWAHVFGVDVARQPHRVRQLVGVTGQYASVDENLTATENLWLVGRLQGIASAQARAIARDLLEALGVNKKAYIGHTVSYHEPGGYVIHIPDTTWSGDDSDGIHYQITDHFTGDEACDLIAQPDYPTTGNNPLQRLPYVGLSPMGASNGMLSEDQVQTFSDGSSVSNPAADSGTAAIAMGGFSYPAPMTTDYGLDDLSDGDGSIGGLNVTGTWIFTGPQLQAQITETREGVDATGPSTFTLPVTAATACGSGS